MSSTRLRKLFPGTVVPVSVPGRPAARTAVSWCRFVAVARPSVRRGPRPVSHVVYSGRLLDVPGSFSRRTGSCQRPSRPRAS